MESAERFLGPAQVIKSSPISQLLKYFTSYKNNVSGYCNYEAPPIFRGGLLADDMGLGKTLSMICLIAANQARHTHPSRRSKSRDLGAVEACSIKTTLLIVPPACTF